MQDLRYPIGRFEMTDPPDTNMRKKLLSQLLNIPDNLRNAVMNLSNEQLDTPYRSGGWTVRQVVHHLADANMNWYIRTKLALTEENSLVKPYDEVLWAELYDARKGSTEPSLMLLEGLHQRWVEVFSSLNEKEWKRRINHPDRGTFVLDTSLAMHVWHGQHHTAHITALRKRMGWS